MGATSGSTVGAGETDGLETTALVEETGVGITLATGVTAGRGRAGAGRGEMRSADTGVTAGWVPSAMSVRLVAVGSGTARDGLLHHEANGRPTMAKDAIRPPAAKARAALGICELKNSRRSLSPA